MMDQAISVVMLSVVGVVLAVYLVRTLLHGRARSERALKYGGSLLLGVPVMEWAYWALSPIVAALAWAGVKPNGVTMFSLLPGVGAGVALGTGHFGLGCLLATAAALCDALDGALARRCGIASPVGETLDSLVDRVTELALFGGLVVHFRHSLWLTLLSLGALAAAFMVSYTTAKAEAMNVKPPRGAMRRAERALYLLTAAGVTPLWGLWMAPDDPSWLRHLPIVVAQGLIVVVAGTSTVIRGVAILKTLDTRGVFATPGPGPELPPLRPRVRFSLKRGAA
jgi:phosphatidylglycerophosphate synthase